MVTNQSTDSPEWMGRPEEWREQFLRQNPNAPAKDVQEFDGFCNRVVRIHSIYERGSDNQWCACQQLVHAASYGRAGMSCIPLKLGTKESAVGWKRYQRERASEDQLRRWFGRGVHDLAIICGAVSGNLMVLDFESVEVYEAWAKLVEAEFPGLLPDPAARERRGDVLAVAETPRPGRHVFFRCEQARPGEKLAEVREVNPATGIEDIRLLIETRGEGQYVKAVGSAEEKRRWLGGICGMPFRILAEEAVERLLEHARSFDRRDALPSPNKPTRGGSSPVQAGRLSPVERARRYLAKCAPAISGQSGHDQTFKVACRAIKGFGLSVDEAWPLLLEYNQRCEPPWSEEELRHKAEDAWAKGTSPDLRNASGAGPGNRRVDELTSSTPARAIVVDLEEVDQEDVKWLWRGRIPLGKLVGLGGDPGLGKTTVMLDLIARLSRGEPMPDGTGGGRPVNSLLLVSEDGLGDTIKPRLVAARADLSRIKPIEGIDDGKGNVRPFFLPSDLATLEKLIEEHQAGLVFLDPLDSFLDPGTDTNSGPAMRERLQPVIRMLERQGCTLVFLGFLNKSESVKAMYRLLGSIAILAQTRSTLGVYPDPEHKGACLLARVKCNLASPVPTLRYRLEEQQGPANLRINWCGTSSLSADEILKKLAGQEHRPGKRELAEFFLRGLLLRGPCLKAECVEKAKKFDIPSSTLEKAAKKLGVKTKKQEGGKNLGSLWSLP